MYYGGDLIIGNNTIYDGVNSIKIVTISPSEKISPQRHRGHGETQRKRSNGTTKSTKGTNNNNDFQFRAFRGLSFLLSSPLCISARNILLHFPAGGGGQFHKKTDTKG
jgi:hypothetical protein